MSRAWTALIIALLLPLGWGLVSLRAEPPAQSNTPSNTQSNTQSKMITMTFTGDVSMTWRALPANLKRLDWKKNPLRFFATEFKAADLAVSNFEGVLAPGDPKYAEPRLNLWAPVASGQVFKDAHVDLVSNANNHAFDGRDTGVLRTLAALRKTGVKVFGIGRTEAEARAPYVFRKAGACVAILPGTTKSNKGSKGKARVALYPWKDWAEMVRVVRHTVQKVCPNVVVYLHWGTEKIHYPKRKIKAFGRKIIDAGAMLLVGHHPHVLQGVEYYGGGAIVYSLGNFVFSNPNKSHRRTGLLKVQLQPLANKRVRLSRLELIPTTIHRGDYTPRRSTRIQAEDLLRRMRAYCKPFGTQVVMHQGRIRFLSATDVRVPHAANPAP
jgi:poly-gamma-glutamate capsule biosynthesis protein CapA/YwtB (metallophosphatase superfamily)